MELIDFFGEKINFEESEHKKSEDLNEGDIYCNYTPDGNITFIGIKLEKREADAIGHDTICIWRSEECRGSGYVRPGQSTSFTGANDLIGNINKFDLYFNG